MSVKPIPDGYRTVTPYLIVPGVEQLIHFIKEAFDGQERTRSTTPDGQVMHAEVMIGDSVLMMGEANQEFPPRPGTLHLYVADVDSTYQRALQAGAKSLREPEDQFYGDRSAGVEDRHGNHWWIAAHVRDVSDEEIKQFMESGHK
jgi:PhnB protein